MTDFEKATKEYADAVVTLEREEHRASLEPFDAKEKWSIGDLNLD